jgi:hypothetical protein
VIIVCGHTKGYSYWILLGTKSLVADLQKQAYRAITTAYEACAVLTNYSVRRWLCSTVGALRSRGLRESYSLPLGCWALLS